MPILVSWNVAAWKTCVPHFALGAPLGEQRAPSSSRAKAAAVRAGFLAWLEGHGGVDVLALQEVKCKDADLRDPKTVPTLVADTPGWESFWAPSRTKARAGLDGVATFARQGMTLRADRDCLDSGGPLDREGRCILTEHPDFVLFNVYVPNSGGGAERYAVKTRFLQALREAAAKERRKGKRVIITGDFNIGRRPQDCNWRRRLVTVPAFLEAAAAAETSGTEAAAACLCCAPSPGPGAQVQAPTDNLARDLGAFLQHRRRQLLRLAEDMARRWPAVRSALNSTLEAEEVEYRHKENNISKTHVAVRCRPLGSRTKIELGKRAQNYLKSFSIAPWRHRSCGDGDGDDDVLKRPGESMKISHLGEVLRKLGRDADVAVASAAAAGSDGAGLCGRPGDEEGQGRPEEVVKGDRELVAMLEAAPPSNVPTPASVPSRKKPAEVGVRAGAKKRARVAWGDEDLRPLAHQVPAGSDEEAAVFRFSAAPRRTAELLRSLCEPCRALGLGIGPGLDAGDGDAVRRALACKYLTSGWAFPDVAWFNALITEDGMVDTYASTSPRAADRFTCFDQYKNKRYTNEGSRIDYFLVDAPLLEPPPAPSQDAAASAADKRAPPAASSSSSRAAPHPDSRHAAHLAVTGRGAFKSVAFSGGGMQAMTRAQYATQFTREEDEDAGGGTSAFRCDILGTPPHMSDHLAIRLVLPARSTRRASHKSALRAESMATTKACQPHSSQRKMTSFFTKRPAGSMAVAGSSQNKRPATSEAGAGRAGKKKKKSIMDFFRK